MVKAEGDFTQESLKDQLWSIINMHLPSSLSGAAVIILVIGLGLGGFALAEWRRKRRVVVRRAVTSLELNKCPA